MRCLQVSCPMYYLTYVSSAVRPFTPDELYALLEVCKRNNARDGITGMMLYKDGNFMQVLEGHETVVRQTYARIAMDPRHNGLITLQEAPQKMPQFPDWSMGFVDLRTDQVRPQSYSEFLNSPLTGHEFSADPGRAQRLLLAFKSP
jgi:Sensors of blue-light using FAD